MMVNNTDPRLGPSPPSPALITVMYTSQGAFSRQGWVERGKKEPLHLVSLL